MGWNYYRDNRQRKYKYKIHLGNKMKKYDRLKNNLTLEEQLESKEFYEAYLEKRNLVHSDEVFEGFKNITTIIEKIKKSRTKKERI